MPCSGGMRVIHPVGTSKWASKVAKGVIHKHYSMPVIMLGIIGYAIMVVTTLRPLEGIRRLHAVEAC